MPKLTDLLSECIDARGAYIEARERLRTAEARYKAQGPGRYKYATVYHVGETNIRSHTRRAYTAIRWRTAR